MVRKLLIKLFKIKTFEDYKEKCVLTPKYYKDPEKGVKIATEKAKKGLAKKKV